jgi:single-strand DNA-binding protein
MSQSPTTIVGNVTNDPELKFTEGGKPSLKFGVAVNTYWTDASGEKKERTSYFNVVVWGYLAEDSAAVLEKGVGVVVTGRLDQRSWEGTDGKKNSTIEVVADSIGVQTRSIESFTRKRRGNSDDGASKRPAPAQRRSQPAISDEEEPF